MTMGMTILGWIVLTLAMAGSAYTIACAVVVRRFFAAAGKLPMRLTSPVTLLKPLHGTEPRLRENLATFLSQDGVAELEMICGVGRAADPALAAVPDDPRVRTIVDSTAHGANGKVSNLVNMAAAATHPILVQSDSDIAVTSDYLTRVTSALAASGVGAVTCLYRGRGDAGFWSRLAAAGISYDFLPGATFGVATGLATPCMGSTIALTRDTLNRIGGFAAFADTLADDYAIGAAVRGLGLKVAVPPMLVVHGSDETSLAALWRHELRWGATVRGVAPLAYAASVISMPLPLALIGAALLGFAPLSLVAIMFALGSRLLLARTIDRVAGARTAPLAWLPLRDLLSFAVFVASFFVRSVDWRGERLRMEPSGRVVAEAESPR